MVAARIAIHYSSLSYRVAVFQPLNHRTITVNYRFLSQRTVMVIMVRSVL